MFRRFSHTFAFVLIALSLVNASSAIAAEYEVDASHSNVKFTVKHLMSKVSGQFKEFQGKFIFDEKTPEKTTANFIIKAASIDTNHAKRDEHLKNEDFFDVKKYSDIKFESKKVSKAGKNKFKLVGDLTMHGVTKPVTFTVDYLGKGKDPWGNQKVAFEAKSVVNRKDFGMVWNKTLDTGGLLVGEEIQIELQIEADQKGA